ncbi:hypothetical protein [Paenibacillus sp. GCM10027626]|uniref:hypothetical protein n=1 Tax=Paenibacillus sp. GCM10027626 TaxID=3273411 RepID=UPI003630158D
METARGIDIPWDRMTTPYGRGTALPVLMDQQNYPEIASLIDHQSTLWQVTPWVLLRLLQELRTKRPPEVSLAELDLYDAVASSFVGKDVANALHVEYMRDLLREECLWPSDSDEEADEERWSEEEPPGYDELNFSSYYYYSYQMLLEAVPVFKAIGTENDQLRDAAERLIARLQA